MDLVYRILEKHASLEIFMRCGFERLSFVKRVALKTFNNDKNRNYHYEIKEGQWDNYKSKLKELNIQKGDILLVHSSIKGLSTLGASANEIIDFLLELVGKGGTLVFPTYPDEDNMRREDGTYYYDSAQEVPWTGKLPRTFLEYPDVKRSLFPHNTLAAKGMYAEDMMQDNLKAEYSQGKYTAWDFCIRHDMKILYLGVKACTSCTIVHYPEDIMEDKYPVNGWFKKDRYCIKTQSGDVWKNVYIRNKNWFKYYKMFNTGYWLINKGYLEEYDIDGAYIGFMGNVKKMCDELCERAGERDLLFGVPKKFLKS